ncbi:MAG: Uma2 family endonuclease [Desulfitobacteriaceae bacterium]
MSIPDTSRQYTYEDWSKWDGRWELINGKAYNMTPAPSSQHQFTVGELFFMIRSFFNNKNCLVFTAPFDVFFSESGDYESPDEITQPDIAVVCDKNQVTKQGCNGSPTIIVEVLSPSTALKDYNEKFQAYEKYGVKEYWIVDPANRMVHVHSLHEGLYTKRVTYGDQDQLKSAIFDDLIIPLQPIFEFHT